MKGCVRLGSRVKLLRKQLNLSQEAFGLKLGVTGAGISKIENGLRNLTEQMIILICKEYNINESWLRFGEGEMFKEKLPFGLEQIAEIYDLDNLDIKIIREYLSLDTKNRKVIKEYIMRITDFDEIGYNKDQQEERKQLLNTYRKSKKDNQDQLTADVQEEKRHLELLMDGKQLHQPMNCAEQT